MEQFVSKGNKFKVATNRRGENAETVAARLTGLLAGEREHAGASLDLFIASAYFNVGGFTLLRDELRHAGRVRLLLGAEPTDADLVTTLYASPTARQRATLKSRILDHQQRLLHDRDRTDFTPVADAATVELIDWLQSEGVEVRRLTTAFLHGKTFTISSNDAATVVGSSNMTRAGLSLNRELNVADYDYQTVEQVRAWFDEQWDEAEEYDLAALYESRLVLHNPHHVYLRMLYEYCGGDLEEMQANEARLGLTEFQVDGVWRAARILDQRRGVLIADEVGLGKTFVGGELIRQAMEERRQHVLVICPATLRDATWVPFLAKRRLAANVVSFQQLARDAAHAGSTKGSIPLPLDDYAMIVVDEAHYLRNAGTQVADAMRTVMGGKYEKDLVLLTATPVNNSLDDLYNLVSYITSADSGFSDVGIPSLLGYFNRAKAMDVNQLSAEHLFQLIDAIAVRRTRKFVKKYYSGTRITIDGVDQEITFPKAELHRVDYSLDHLPQGYFERLAVALGADEAPVVEGDNPADGPSVALSQLVDTRRPGEVLSMARYVPSIFERGGETAQYQVQNAGLLRAALLKRFESSAVAFRMTLDKMIASHRGFLRVLEQGYVATGDALTTLASSDDDATLDEMLASEEDLGYRTGFVEAASGYMADDLREAVTADLGLLVALRDDIVATESVPDPKIDQLVEELVRIIAEAEKKGLTEADRRDKRKVLVFSFFADTVGHVTAALSARIDADPRLLAYRGRIASVTGGQDDEKGSAIAGFAPRTVVGPSAGPDADRYDILVTTDVLSEGVNLQQARHIVNYDLPWNPMRLVQRHGRVDRIGSTHDTIHLRCFFPAVQVERMLDLEEILLRKLTYANATFGAAKVLPNFRGFDRQFADTRQQIEMIQAEDADVLDTAESAAGSSQEFRRRLANEWKSKQTRDAVLGLPWGAGSSFVSASETKGVVFCARVDGHDSPFFRFVAWDESGRPSVGEFGSPDIDTSTYVALSLADPGDAKPPLAWPAGVKDSVFASWDHARASIHADWMEQTDPRNLQGQVPKSLRDAAGVIREAKGLEPAERLALAARLEQPSTHRVVREIRRVLTANPDGGTVLVEALRAKADELRLRAPQPPVELPEISLGEIRVVAWMVVG